MGKKTTIATFGLNKDHLRGKTQEEMAQIVLDKVDSVQGYHPDLICLPEIFLKTGGDIDNPNVDAVTRGVMEALKRRARAFSSYISATVYEPSKAYPGMRYNTTYLIDRAGRVAGKYRKQHPVNSETDVTHVLPGDGCPVFDTDFGRVGIRTCFDIGWRDDWKTLADRGAQLVIWSAAYDGGNLLNAYAALNMYYVVSTVRTDHARIIDLTGRTITQGAVWNGLAMATVDLETTLFHIDDQYQKIDEIRRELGDAVTIRAYSEENVFTIEPNDPAWPIARIKERFGLMDYKAYHADATAHQEAWRGRCPAEPLDED